MLFEEVNPNKFVKPGIFGRRAWTKAGIGDDYRYHYRPGVKVGEEAEKSLDHWAVSAGVYGIQARLVALGFLKAPVRGSFGYGLRTAVIAFQKDAGIEADGTVGISDARALWTPVIDAAESDHSIPDHWVRGQINGESSLDPGALGWQIYYPDFRGVDRGMGQINSEAHPEITWGQSYQPWTAIEWTAKRLRDSFDTFQRQFPKTPVATLWEAAVCAHNSPVAAYDWLKTGTPSPDARKYVDLIKAARY